MASIHKDVLINVDGEQAWAALRNVSNTARVFAGVLTDARLDGDVRTVTFANGMTVREQIVDVDDSRRRLAYSVLGVPFAHHSASMQIIAEEFGRCRFVWISDFLPDSVVADITPLIDAGCQALKRNLEEGTQRVT